ncbi:hypothetical protein AVEN_140119-1 [Araneus ventricosus]|uniref:Uncharacterized protein n=1 Tax=Araneus ventricosus TaxID=182803 RepID=A0A4Y2LQA7_ARAVE|nr:hypothetical protein AVEN_140119-1 [Araneus ventricosus]
MFKHAFLGKTRKEDLIILARELEEEVTPDVKRIDLRNLIVARTNYDIVRGLLNTVISQRTEKAEERKRELESEERRRREEKEKKGNSNWKS